MIIEMKCICIDIRSLCKIFLIISFWKNDCIACLECTGNEAGENNKKEKNISNGFSHNHTIVEFNAMEWDFNPAPLH